jgi:Family of unknown function (DUF5681)
MADDGKDGDDDKVGYRRPPRRTRFKPGQSGNPRGRPKGLRAFKSDMREVLNSPVRIVKDGKLRRVSAQVAGILRLMEAALTKGDIRALEKFLTLAQVYGLDEPLAADQSGTDAEDAAILEDFVRRRGLTAAASFKGKRKK